MTLKRWWRTSASVAVLALAASLAAPQANAMSLEEAMAIAVESNPEIGQAIENREAVEFELRQARGLYLPSIDLEASAGARRLDNQSRRALGLQNDTLNSAQIGLTVTQTIFDSGARRAEVNAQAARVDSASFRVLERSELIGLAVVQDYLEYMLQASIVEATKSNLAFHQSILGEISEGISGGALTEADRQQAQERLFAAKARQQEALSELEQAKIRFFKTVGVPLSKPTKPRSVAGALPKTLDTALGLARENNPRVKSSMADIDAAQAGVAGARSKYGPTVLFEGAARTGWDADGSEQQTHDLSARVVMRWNLYRGGIDIANEQEQIRRAGEQRLFYHQVHRELEETVRLSWDERIRQAGLAETLRAQSATNRRLVASYRDQFQVGQRSLLDVLDAQNTSFNTAILASTAAYASLFAEYKLLAATGKLLDTFGIAPPKQAAAYARDEFDTPATKDPETYKRIPSDQTRGLPFDLLAPLRKK